MLTVEPTMDAVGKMEPTSRPVFLLLQMPPTALVSTLLLTTCVAQLITAPDKPTNLGA